MSSVPNNKPADPFYGVQQIETKGSSHEYQSAILKEIIQAYMNTDTPTAIPAEMMQASVNFDTPDLPDGIDIGMTEGYKPGGLYAEAYEELFGN